MMQMMDLHIHSIYSDGSARIEEIVEYSRKMGLKIVAITDHCSRVHLTVGGRMLEPEIAIERAEIIYNMNSSHDDIIVLNGIESDIMERGRVVFPKGLDRNFFDLVIGSIHVPLIPERWAKWVILAIRSSNIDILGHPLSYVRGPIPFELVERVIIELASREVAFELNASYLSPPAKILSLCKEYDVAVSIGSDAHSIYQIGRVESCISLVKKYGLRVFHPDT